MDEDVSDVKFDTNVKEVELNPTIREVEFNPSIRDVIVDDVYGNWLKSQSNRSSWDTIVSGGKTQQAQVPSYSPFNDHINYRNRTNYAEDRQASFDSIQNLQSLQYTNKPLVINGFEYFVKTMNVDNNYQRSTIVLELQPIGRSLKEHPPIEKDSLEDLRQRTKNFKLE